jgi:hypothetical protein
MRVAGLGQSHPSRKNKDAARVGQPRWCLNGLRKTWVGCAVTRHNGECAKQFWMAPEVDLSTENRSKCGDRT